MFEVMRDAFAKGKIGMASTWLFNAQQAAELGMFEVVTNDPYDGSIMSYWISDLSGVSHAEELLANGVDLSETPAALWEK